MPVSTANALPRSTAMSQRRYPRIQTCRFRNALFTLSAACRLTSSLNDVRMPISNWPKSPAYASDVSVDVPVVMVSRMFPLTNTRSPAHVNGAANGAPLVSYSFAKDLPVRPVRITDTLEGSTPAMIGV